MSEKGCNFCKWAVILAVIAIVTAGLVYMDGNLKQYYVFDENKLNEIARTNIARNLTSEELVAAIINDLALTYV